MCPTVWVLDNLDKLKRHDLLNLTHKDFIFLWMIHAAFTIFNLKLQATSGPVSNYPTPTASSPPQ